MNPPSNISCEQMLALLSDYLDGELAPDDQARVEVHLKGCNNCSRFGGELSNLLTQLRDQVRGAPLPPGLHERLARALESPEEP